MSKKTKVFGALVALVVVGFGAYKMKAYYDGRYVASGVYYVKVPENQSTTVGDLLDDSGKVMDQGMEYSFVGINEKGEKRDVSFFIATKDSSKLLQPGQYVEVTTSDTIVLKEAIVSKAQVPSSVVGKLESFNQ